MVSVSTQHIELHCNQRSCYVLGCNQSGLGFHVTNIDLYAILVASEPDRCKKTPTIDIYDIIGYKYGVFMLQ